MWGLEKYRARLCIERKMKMKMNLRIVKAIMHHRGLALSGAAAH